MKLNHLNLAVDDVPEAGAFLERHFGLRLAGYPRTFHLGFIQAGESEVDEINRRLREDGLDVEAPSHQHGAWSFSFQAPGDYPIAVRAPHERHG